MVGAANSVTLEYRSSSPSEIFNAKSRQYHLMATLDQERQCIQAGSMRHRRHMQLGILRSDMFDIGEITDAHKDQSAMAEHRSLRLPRGATGVKNPPRSVGSIATGSIERPPMSRSYRSVRTQIISAGSCCAAVTAPASETNPGVVTTSRAPELPMIWAISRGCSRLLTGTMHNPAVQHASMISSISAQFSIHSTTRSPWQVTAAFTAQALCDVRRRETQLAARVAEDELQNVFSPLFFKDLLSAIWALLRRRPKDEIDDGVTYGGHSRLRRRPVDSFFSAPRLRGDDVAGRRRQSLSSGRGDEDLAMIALRSDQVQVPPSTVDAPAHKSTVP